MSPKRGLFISIGNTSSNHHFSGDMLVFRGVDHARYSVIDMPYVFAYDTFFSHLLIRWLSSGLWRCGMHCPVFVAVKNNPNIQQRMLYTTSLPCQTINIHTNKPMRVHVLETQLIYIRISAKCCLLTTIESRSSREHLFVELRNGWKSLENPTMVNKNEWFQFKLVFLHISCGFIFQLSNASTAQCHLFCPVTRLGVKRRFPMPGRVKNKGGS